MSDQDPASAAQASAAQASAAQASAAQASASQDNAAQDNAAPGSPEAATPSTPAAVIRRVAGRVLTGLAGLLVVFALVVPTDHLRPAALLRIPVEALLTAALVLVLPVAGRRIVAAIVGAALGALAIMKVLDAGFRSSFDRPFDPVADWSFLPPAVEFLARSIGRAGATGVTVGAGLLAVAVLVLMALSVLRLTPLVVGHRRPATAAIAVLTVAWVACSLTGVAIVPGVPVAAHPAYDRLRQVQAGLLDVDVFAAEVARDAFRDTPGDALLTGLRGKDVVLAFVESYGRVALDDPVLAPRIGALLDAGTRRLDGAGYASRSAFLTSSTAGGGSWLAHSTLQSGLWVNNQQRYTDLVAGDRLTLTGAFGRAGWRTVDVVPANTDEWEGAAFYGFDQVYDDRSLGYRGPSFSFASIPDQFTLAAFQRAERAGPHPPVMAELDLYSSHAPWAPIPDLVGWSEVGDGSGYPAPAGAADPADIVFQRDPDRVRDDYGSSVEYTLNTLISYVETYGDDNLVLVFLGDHQPSPVVAGEGATRDVPITIVARDPAVLDRIAGWNWHPGLRPGPSAPVWRMDAFRDHFLTAFGSQPQPGHR